MPLIDRSYFVVELNIAKTDTTAVQENLDALIVKREPELLKNILGYELYKAFTEGLLEMPVPAIWTNLLLGVDYTDRFGRLQHWRGLVSAPPAVVNAVDRANRIPVIADADAVSSQTILVPAALVNRAWSIEKRAIGPLRDDEFDVSDDGASVAFNTAVQLNDTYWFFSNDLSLEQTSGDDKQSLIANYVYYWYMRRDASQSTPVGEVVAQAENSTINGPGEKMCRAWNEMVDIIEECVDYLDSNRTLYVNWRHNQRYKVYQEFRHITRF